MLKPLPSSRIRKGAGVHTVAGNQLIDQAPTHRVYKQYHTLQSSESLLMLRFSPDDEDGG